MIEYEIKALDINSEDMILRLEQHQAIFLGEKNFKRYVYDFDPPTRKKWIRLRTDGKVTTLCIKEIVDEESIDGTHEYETEVGDFQITHGIVQRLGYSPSLYQENRRLSYVLDGVAIEIDYWPHIPPYMEIEGGSTQAVESMIEKLDLKSYTLTSENTDKVYERYGIDIRKIPYLSFDIVPEG